MYLMHYNITTVALTESNYTAARGPRFIDRPGVAGAVLQTAFVIHLLSQSVSP